MLDLANDIRSLSDFKRNTTDLLDRLRTTGHPLVLTINGKAEKGDVSKKTEMQKAMEKADFKSVRGNFKFGNNHFPIQNFYLQDVVKNASGELVLKTVATIVENDQDRFASKCPMK